MPAKVVEMFSELARAISTTLNYHTGLFSYVFLQKSYTEYQPFPGDIWGNVQLYSLSLIFKLWSKPHYRSIHFQQDMKDNLKNVAIPGTGIPLSIFCWNWFLCYLSVAILNPTVCFFGAVNKARKTAGYSPSRFIGILVTEYIEHLLHPQDWFSLWRMNCRLISYHSLITQSKDYNQEDKWTFLVDGERLGVPISPFLKVESLVCKNKNIEGGMGIHFYKNAAHGGDWILQERLKNADWLNELLPSNAPLSTMRIITSSTWGQTSNPLYSTHPHPPSVLSPESQSPQTNLEPTSSSSSLSSSSTQQQLISRHIKPLSAVLRLGRENASTDHSSVLFDVDLRSGLIREGLSNAHWYQLPVRGDPKEGKPSRSLWTIWRTCPWLPVPPVKEHPDPPHPVVSGKRIKEEMKEAIEIVTSAHFRMMRDVPLVGWDVAFTDKGVFLLEVNLSCNFFRGKVNLPSYISFLDHYWRDIEKMETDLKK